MDKQTDSDEEDDTFLAYLEKGDFEFSLKEDHSELRSDLEQRLAEARSDRVYWEQIWKDLADYISPAHGKFILQDTTRKKGSASRNKIFSNVGKKALNTLASGMLGGLSGQTKPWFQLADSTPNAEEDPKNGVWLSDVVDIMRQTMHKTNTYDAFYSCYNDIGLFGTHAMIVYEDEDKIFRCHALPIGQYYLSADSKGEITGLYREYRMTLKQMVDQFGLKAVSENARKAYMERRGFETEYTIRQAIQPNKEYDPKAVGVKARAYIDVYWEVGSPPDTLLSYTGFHEKPFVAPAWSRPLGEAYGESPAMEALPDIKQLQFYQKEKAEIIQMYTKPPVVASKALENQPTAFYARGVTFTADINTIGAKPLMQINGDISGVQAETQELKQRIADAFFEDLWLMMNNIEGVQPRSFMEIAERKGEKIVMLSPAIQKVQNEFLSPFIDRVFAIMYRRGLFPEPPDSLKNGADLKIEYVSDLSLAQNVKNTVPIEQLLAITGNMMSVAPEVQAKVDFYQAIDDYSQSIGVPPRIMIPTKKAIAINEQKAQQAQQQQMMEQMPAMAQSAKALSETPVGAGSNALQSMLGL
ncbi:head to tail connecting protein [Caudoviricetes sp.]|nr:head to tail connecting protein [Caudoviricetes sp.]